MPKITIVSSVSNKRRAGAFFNGGANVFEADHFSADQLRAIAADPMLTIVAGEPVTADQVDAFLKAAIAAEPKAGKPAKDAGK